MANRSVKDFLSGTILMLAFMGIMIFITAVLGGSLMKLLGMQYDSIWSIFLFFVVYFIVDFPVDLLVELVPRLLFGMGILQGRRAEMWLYILLDVPVNCGVMMLIDFLMASISLPFTAVLGFSVALCLLNLYMSRSGSPGKGTPVRVFLWEKTGGVIPASRELLMDALVLYCADQGIPCGPDSLRIEDDEKGKPYALYFSKGQWMPHGQLHFSVSHTQRWWLCAFYDGPIGADIEETGRKVNFDVAERFFSDQEQQWLEKAGKTKDHFLQLWVRKEAYVKYLGTGISEGMKSFSVVGGRGILGTDAKGKAQEGLSEESEDMHLGDMIGEGDREAFCTSLFPGDIRDLENYPVPLVGAFCTQKCPSGLDIGFLERIPEQENEENEEGEEREEKAEKAEKEATEAELQNGKDMM